MNDFRNKILEFLGWTELNRNSKLGGYMALRGTSPDGKENQIAPNPTTNLNVVHEAEKLLSKEQWMYYTDLLWANLSIDHERGDTCASAMDRCKYLVITLENFKKESE